MQGVLISTGWDGSQIILRYELYYKAEQIATDKAPSLLIFYEEDYRLIQPYVKGFPLDPMHRINFRKLWLDK